MDIIHQEQHVWHETLIVTHAVVLQQHVYHAVDQIRYYILVHV